MVAYVEEKPTATLHEMKLKLLELFPHSPVSINTISRQLDGSMITVKRLRSVPRVWNTPGVKEERSAFAQWMIARGIHSKLIYIDELATTCGQAGLKRDLLADHELFLLSAANVART